MTAVQGEPRPANLGQGWTVDDSTFGARLALVRQRMGWNIKEAARECGIPAASWGTWESGALPRRYTEMCKLIADRTGADLTWLVMGSFRAAGPASQSVTPPYLELAEQPSRPRDNRPTGHPGITGSRRSARLPRSSRGRAA